MLPALLYALAAEPEAVELDLRPPLRAGLVIGGPVGLTVAGTVFERFSVHGLLGFLGGEPGAILLALDMVYELPEIIGPIGEHGFTSTYFGVGLRYESGQTNESAAYGGRVPLGVAYFDRRWPFELFGEVAIGMSGRPEADTTLDGGLGIRLGF